MNNRNPGASDQLSDTCLHAVRVVLIYRCPKVWAQPDRHWRHTAKAINGAVLVEARPVIWVSPNRQPGLDSPLASLTRDEIAATAHRQATVCDLHQKPRRRELNRACPHYTTGAHGEIWQGAAKEQQNDLRALQVRLHGINQPGKTPRQDYVIFQHYGVFEPIGENPSTDLEMAQGGGGVSRAHSPGLLLRYPFRIEERRIVKICFAPVRSSDKLITELSLAKLPDHMVAPV